MREQRSLDDDRGLRHVGCSPNLLEVLAGSSERSNIGPSNRLVIFIYPARLKMDEAIERVWLCAQT